MAVNPRNCPYAVHGADWVCLQCDDARPVRHDDAGNRKPPPRRNCPKAPPVMEAIRHQIEARLEDKRAAGLCDRTPATIAALLDCCFDCPHFTGQRCARAGSCRDGQEKWIKRLASGDCPNWSDVETAIP